MDHAGVVVNACVVGCQTQRVGDRVLGLGELSLLVEAPSQRVAGMDVSPHGRFVRCVGQACSICGRIRVQGLQARRLPHKRLTVEAAGVEIGDIVPYPLP
jgi:hypothetical protein